MHTQNHLRKLGLNEKEAEILNFLLVSSNSSPSQIARQLNIKRTTVYDILNSLYAKGFVTKIIKRGKYIFQTIEPKLWIHYWKKQEDCLREEKEKFQEALPELENIYQNAKHRPQVIFYEGLDNLQQAVLDSLNVISLEIVGYSAVSQVIKFLPPNLVAYYTNEKIKREIASRFVIKSSEENKTLIENYKNKFYKKDQTKKFTPSYRIYTGGKYNMKNEIMIYDNKVLIVNIIPPHYSATLIQDCNIAEGQKAIFEIAWSSSKTL